MDRFGLRRFIRGRGWLSGVFRRRRRRSLGGLFDRGPGFAFVGLWGSIGQFNFFFGDLIFCWRQFCRNVFWLFLGPHWRDFDRRDFWFCVLVGRQAGYRLDLTLNILALRASFNHCGLLCAQISVFAAGFYLSVAAEEPESGADSAQHNLECPTPPRGSF